MATMRDRFCLCFVFLLLGSTAFAGETTGKGTATDALERKIAAWNRHDLDQVVSAYSKSPDTSMVSSSTEAWGFDALKAQYQKWYGANKDLMGKIGVSDLKAYELGKHNALLTGHYSLNEPGEPQVRGAFSLVFAQTSDGWKIIREQLTSLDKKP